MVVCRLLFCKNIFREQGGRCTFLRKSTRKRLDTGQVINKIGNKAGAQPLPQRGRHNNEQQ